MKVKLLSWDRAMAVAKERKLGGTCDGYIFGIGINYLPWGEEVVANPYNVEHDIYFIGGFGVPVCLTETVN